MNFSLIVCTYKRVKSLQELLDSIKKQTLYPNEILIVDGSPDNQTQDMLIQNTYEKLSYYKVDDSNRGLTKQRNFGINKVSQDMDIVCFLDDDVVLDTLYFKELLDTYIIYPEALGVGGYISNELIWAKSSIKEAHPIKDFYYDGYKTSEGSRFRLRKLLGLDSNLPCGYLPEFSHGRSVSFLPPSGNIYKVEQLMGGVSSFKKEIFNKMSFSTYFEGYGLYEDADFTLRLSKTGDLYINTSAKLAHYHEPSGRPNQYKYGKMVIRNGWYVWRIKYPNPSLIAQIKWCLIMILLILVRFTNVFNSSQKISALEETLGRTIGMISLIFNKPIINKD